MVTRGNILATKNHIAQKIWITDVIRITQLTVHKQNCLEHVQSERVGIILDFVYPSRYSITFVWNAA
jgi:hypothetical protein